MPHPIMRTALTFSFLLLGLPSAYAACTSPAGQEGSLYYDTDDNTLNFCDGTTWRMTGKDDAAAATTGCSTPTGQEGSVIFNDTYNVAQFCNGENWVNMGQENAAAATTGCSSPDGNAGAITYNTTAGWLQYCNGENWVNAGQLYLSATPCPAGFAYIPNSANIEGQTKGWCVSKYEMTPNDTSEWTQDATHLGWSFTDTTDAATKYVAAKSGQTPITDISRNESAAACSSYLKDANGNTLSNGKLLTVELWNKLVTNITNVDENWSGGAIGSGYMSPGFADNDPATTIATGSDSFPATDNMGSPDTCDGGACTGAYWSRTYKTSRGELIWDLAGNVWEWFDDTHGGGSGLWQDFTADTYSFEGISLEPAITTWTSTQGVGVIYNGTGVSAASTYAALFGGYWGNGASAGVWTSGWSTNSPSSTRSGNIGFRCVAPAQ